MSEYKVGEYQGHTIHYSTGAVIINDDNILLLDRVNPPYGLAGPAGHLNNTDQDPLKALKREVREETGLIVVESELAIEEFVPWNTCRKQVEGHEWTLYRCGVRGRLRRGEQEARSLDWYSLDQIESLPLEPVWRYWFQQLGYIGVKQIYSSDL